MVNYPSGIKKNTNSIKPKISISKNKSAANRGMGLESLINQANVYYDAHEIAFITKRPTPINIVKVDYTNGARITDAFFEKQSTTDYNGIFLGHYCDFEAKSTKSKTSFPLNNIYKHQITHLQKVLKAGGLAFFIIQFAAFDEVYVLHAKYVIESYFSGNRKSIPYSEIKEKGTLVPLGFNPILNYLPAVKQLFNL